MIYRSVHIVRVATLLVAIVMLIIFNAVGLAAIETKAMFTVLMLLVIFEITYPFFTRNHYVNGNRKHPSH